MFDTIVTHRKRQHQRLLAGFLSIVMVFVCLPLQVFAAPSEYGDRGEIRGTWIRSSTGEGTLNDRDSMGATFDSFRNQFNQIAGERVTVRGHDYYGLGSTSPSTLWVLENLAKYMLLCDWANYNMVSTESGVYRYNLFHNNTSNDSGAPGQIQTENKWSLMRDELQTIMESLQGDKFKQDGFEWGSEDVSNYLNKLTTYSAWSDVRAKTRADYIRAGQDVQFAGNMSNIITHYYWEQMANILAKEYLTSEEISAAGVNGNRANVGQILDAVVAKLETKQGDTTTETVTDSGQQVTTTKDAHTFKHSVDAIDKSFFLGDQITMRSLLLDKLYATESNIDSPGAHAPTADTPGFYLQTPGVVSGLNANALATFSLPQNLGGLDVSEDVRSVYSMWGAHAAYNLVDYAVNNSEDLDAWLDSDSGHGGTNLDMIAEFIVTAADGSAYNFNANEYNLDGEAFECNICGIPLRDDEATDPYITRINERVRLKVNEYGLNTATSGIHYRYLDMSDADITDDASVTETLGKSIQEYDAVHVVDTSGNVTVLPNVEGDAGLDTAKLIDIFNTCTELQEFMDSYNSILTFAEQIYSYHYEDDPDAPNGDMYGYYWDRLNSLKESYIVLPALLNDIYEKAFLPNYVAVQDTPGVPGGTTEDPNEQVENAKSALSLISNCDINDDHTIICADGEPVEEHARLTDIGYTALAAGVVYDPFISTEGNESYMAVIMDAMKAAGAEDGTQEKIERFLHQALARKKPVYVLDGTHDQWLSEDDVKKAPTGNYRFAYVADLLQGDVNATRIYTVMKGGMAPSTVDSDTWVYSNGTSNRDENGEQTDDNVRYETDSAVPAGSQTMATASEMTAPIMYTSGTTEGFWTGNWAGSASGYASSLGGMTTVLLHNAAQDAKDNEYIKNAESYMIFMNGLGDIVLADGTVILPAIANPAIYNYDNIQYSVDGSTSLGAAVGAILAGTAAAAGVIVATVVTGGTVGIAVVLGATAAGGAGAAVGTAAGSAAQSGLQSLEDMFFTETDSPEVVAAYDSNSAYYPYTAAFMNHYPSTSINVEKKLNITNQNDKGKYVIGIDEHGDILARKITGFNKKTQVNLQYSGGGVTCVTAQGLSFNVESDVKRIGTMLPYYGGEDGDFWSKANMAVKFEFFMCKNSAYNSDDQAFFPLEATGEAILQESYLDRAGPLMTSAKRFLMERHPTTEATAAHPAFNADLYIIHMAGQGLMGTMYGETLQKNYQISYDELVQDTGNRLLTFFVQLVESAVDSLGNIDGVLAIKNGYENKFFNMIVSFIQEFYGLIAVVLLIIVAVKFLKGHYNMLFVLFIGAMCFCGFEVYANWMPTMVPNAYNFAVNDAVEQIVWNTVAVSAESYSETYTDSSRKDPTTGEPKPYTATMTLYKMSQQDMRDMASRLGTTYADLKKGTIYYIDESAGIFVQGDAIKISIDRLLVNNSMRGLHQSQWQQLDAEFADSDSFITPITEDTDMIANPYSVQITNPYVSLEAYYMPFNEIERAFLIQLNKFSSLFRMEHNVYNYGRNLYKDSFLFNNYTNSGIFTAPGDKDVLTENIRIGSVVSRYRDPDRAMEDFLYRIYGDEGDRDGAVFPVPEDWLGVAAVFRSPSENFKDSLWGKAMKNKGWYDDDWNIINPDKLNDLIYYMNTQTKQFVIANSDQLNFCSDENAIKIVAMYATTTFTHYTSEFGGWLYPNYVNAADISLKDALYGSMTTLKDRNFSYDGTVVNTVAKNLGVFGVIFILLITVFACVFVFVMTYLVPILYAMFGGIIVFKLINNSNSVGLVKGYVKVTAVTAILYFIFSLSMRLVEVGGYAWYGYLGCALLMFLCCYFLFWVVLSVIQNAGEMGNDVLGQNLLRGLDHITHGAVRKLTASNFTVNRMNRGYNGRNTFLFSQHAAQYGRGYGVDSWDYVRGDRSRYGYSRYSDVYNEYGHDSLYEGRESRLPFSGRRQSRYEDRRTAQRFRRR